jgi:uncharacterized protein (TIGR00369 family)
MADGKTVDFAFVAGRVDAMPFARRLGASLERAGEGHARLRLAYRDENTTFQQALHGGAIASLLELAGHAAAWTTVEPADAALQGMTLSCHVSFLAGALGEEVFGEGRVLRRGKEIVYSEVSVVNGAGKQLAHGSHVYRLFAPATG